MEGTTKNASEVQRDERVNFDGLGVVTVWDIRFRRGQFTWTLVDQAGRNHYRQVHPAVRFRTV